MSDTNWPDQLAFQSKACGLPTFAREYRFHSTRRWKFDLAFPSVLIAVEVDGGGFVNGRHSRGAGIEADAEKFAEAAILGWTVIRVTPKHVTNGAALNWIEKLIRARKQK